MKSWLWLRFWSPEAWRTWMRQRSQWRDYRSAAVGPDGQPVTKPGRPVSPAWVPGAILVGFIALAPSAEPPLAEAAATETTVSTTTTTTVVTTTSTTTIVSTVEPPTSTSVPSVPQPDLLLSPPALGESGDPQGNPPEGSELVVVSSITDGDTLDVARPDGTVVTVRLIGINTPEANECFSDEASEVLSVLAPFGAQVSMTSDVSDVDQYDRKLRYLWTGSMSVNEEIVRRGAGISRRYQPDTAMAERLEQAQEDAKGALLGLWAPEACGPRADALISVEAIEFDPPGNENDALNEEWVKIRNDGENLVDLSGWSIKDESASNRYDFPAVFALAPGESVTVHSGCGDDFGAVLFWCSVGAAVWNNDGDTVFLLDPSGNAHSTHSYAGTIPATTQSPPTSALGFVGGGVCDPSYPDVCIPSAPPDLDCGDVTHRRFRVLPPDPHGFDGNDDDGVGCESG